MAHALPHLDAGVKPGSLAGKLLTTKNLAKEGPAEKPATFEAQLKAQTARKAAEVKLPPGTAPSATEKPAAPQNAKLVKTATPEVAPKAVKAEVKEKKAPSDLEAAFAALAHLPLAEPSAPKPKSVAPEATEALAPAKTGKPKLASAERPGDRSVVEANADKAALGEQVRFEQAKFEARKADKDGGPKVTVVDRRTDKDKPKKVETDPAQPSVAKIEPVAAKTETKAVNEVQAVFQSVTGKPKDNFETAAKSTPVAPQDAAAFQKFLVEKGYGQLVEQARIILKNDSQGEIRMTLYPETLGKIKVSLNLDDKHLAGEIFVENQTVREILQDNMGDLLQSFREGGFGDMNIQVSVGDGSNQKGSDGTYAQTFQAAGYDRSAASAPDALPAARISAWSDRQVNLTA